MRRVAVLAAFAFAIVIVPSVGAFPPGTCNGNACTGATTDSFVGVPVCVPGTTTYWEDSYIPDVVRNPQLTKFTYTPKPPCTGATTVSEPTSDPWPADNADPDGRPAGKKEPGKAIFRFRWTVTVPAGAKSRGTMNVAWTLAWTKPTGSTATTTSTTTATSGAPRYDMTVHISPPSSISAGAMLAGATELIEVVFNVSNNGPAESPFLTKTGLEVELGILETETPGQPDTRRRTTYVYGFAPHGCYATLPPACGVHPLAPHGEQTFAVNFHFTPAVIADVKAALNQHLLVFLHVVAHTHLAGCPGSETTCANNSASVEIPVR